MKRAASTSSKAGIEASKRPRVGKAAAATKVPEYHLTPSVKDEDGSIVWPAPQDRIEAARALIREW